MRAKTKEVQANQFRKALGIPCSTFSFGAFGSKDDTTSSPDVLRFRSLQELAAKASGKRTKGQASGGLPAGGLKHPGCSEMFWQLFFFLHYGGNGGHVLERGGLAGERVRECPVNVFYVRIYQSRLRAIGTGGGSDLIQRWETHPSPGFSASLSQNSCSSLLDTALHPRQARQS